MSNQKTTFTIYGRKIMSITGNLTDLDVGDKVTYLGETYRVTCCIRSDGECEIREIRLKKIEEEDYAARLDACSGENCEGAI
jgi:hypothetical protein